MVCPKSRRGRQSLLRESFQTSCRKAGSPSFPCKTGHDGGGEDTAAVKWTISRSPACWIDPAEVQQWITQRGFTKVAAVVRLANRAWGFEGDTPVAVCTSTFHFSSGAIISRYQPRDKKGKGEGKGDDKKEDEPKKSRWGAPIVARQPDEKMFPPITEKKPPVEEISETATEQDGDAEMTVEGKRPAMGSPPTPAAKSLKTTREAVPFAFFYDVVENEGKGDCFYIAVSQRQPTNSTCVRLVAAGVKADIYVWAKGSKGEWSLFGREPGAGRKSNDIWLKLEDQHYEWLKPKILQGFQKEEHATLTEEWRTRAFSYPTAGLQGKGQDEDVRSIFCLSVTPSSKLAAEARSP